MHQLQKDKPWPDDSLRYYKRVMQQRDSLSINRVLTAENLVTSTDDQGRSLFFTGQA
ncbi:MAG: hypothetical protein Q8918_13950 [Bacteroidota bacterium]|nr:hypothetical protein [Bacteroidota bacterium]